MPLRLLRLIALTVIITVVTASSALADNVVADSDGLTPLAASVLDFGTVCAGSTTTKPVVVGVTRQGTGTNVFKGGSVVTASVFPTPPGSSITAAVRAPNTITLPADWASRPNGTESGTVTSDVTFKAGAAGNVSGLLVYRASGTNTSNAPLTRDTGLPVAARVASCDSAPPTLNLPGDITAEATGPNGAVVNYTATATDTAPANPAVTCTPPSGAVFPLGTTTVNCSSRDGAGNTATGSFKVIVRDTTPPALSGTPKDITAEASAASGAIVTYTAPTAQDVVDGAPPVGCEPASGSTFPLGAPTTVTCSATDRAGNTGTSSFVVRVEDTTKPGLTLPGNATLEAPGPGGAIFEYTATATDSVDGQLTPTCVPPGTTFPLGTTTVRCTVGDAAGNTNEGSFSITVHDTTAPELTVSDGASAEATGPDGAAVQYAATATDAVSGNVPVACTKASGATFPLGQTTVTCSASDAAGNPSEKSFVVTVVDTTGPKLTLPADVKQEATGPAGAAVSYEASAVDLVDGPVPVTCEPPSGGTFRLGTTTVSCSARDSRGNEATGSSFFIIEITDTTPPALTLPAPITAEATGPDGAAVDYTATANDLVDLDRPVGCTPPSGATFPLGESTVDCTSTDTHNNSANGSFAVTVVDTTPPALTLPAPITAEATGPDGAAVDYTATANDLVDLDRPVGCTPPSGATFPLGETTVDCTSADTHNNSANGTFAVTVRDTTAPTSIAFAAGIGEGQRFYFGSVPGAPTCTAQDAVSAVSCVVTGHSTAVGNHTLTATATDAAGNSSTATRSYSVLAWTKSGFFNPVDMSTGSTATYNTVKGGSTVPLKFEVFAGPSGVNELTTTTVLGATLATSKVSCQSGAAIDEIEVLATGGTALRYDTAAPGQFIYNWKTPTGAACYQVSVKMADGQSITALFRTR